MKKILLTGFEPFGGERINPAVEAMNRLKGRTLGQHVIVGLELPTVFGKSTDTLIAAMEEMGPDIVIGLGQAGGRAEITFERIAINMDDAAIPDNDGNQPLDWPIVAEGPTAYWSTLPVKAMTDQLRARGIPASVSNTAGTFVCNHLFYGLMHHIAVSGRPIRGGFIHVPYLPEQAVRHPGAPSMALDQIVLGLELAIGVLT